MESKKNSKSLTQKIELGNNKRSKASHSRKILKKKIKKIRKKSFITSRTGRNINKNKGLNVVKKKQISYWEDEDYVFTKKKDLLNKTISQKNDNDIDSEPEIIMMGVKYLHRKLLQAICKEKKDSEKRIKRVRKIKKVDKKKNNKIQDYFSRQAPSFNTPSDRRVSVNDIAYLNSIMSSNKTNKMSFCRNLKTSTDFSNFSIFNDSKKSNSGKFWIEGKQKNSLKTLNTDLNTTVAKVWSRKDSNQFKNIENMNGSLGSMFMESPHRRKI
jgi:hypothetical protein